MAAHASCVPASPENTALHQSNNCGGARVSQADLRNPQPRGPRAMGHTVVMGEQEDYVLRALEERDVRFVRLWFTDVLGFLKSVAVAPAELDNAFDEGIGFDG